MEKVINELELKGIKNTGKITASNLPKIQINPEHAKMLFSNLLDNALKFHKEGAPNVKVTVGAKKEGSQWLFKIHDNGIGIDKSMHKDVFRPFRQLQPDNYEGNGTGLTYARKIVQLYNGDIWITSHSEGGTDIFFTL